MPRVAIEKLKLIEIDDLIGLIGKNLQTIQSALSNSPYGEQISAIASEKTDSISLERAIMLNYSETIQRIVGLSSGNVRRLLLTFLKKLEVSNLKIVLRAIKSKMDVAEAIENIVPVELTDLDKWQSILMANSVEDAIETLPFLEHGKILKKALKEIGNLGDLSLLEVTLDRAIYREILKEGEKLGGTDKKIFKELLSIELDTTNVKIILKSKELSISPKVVKEYLMPHAFLDEETLDEIMKAPNLKNMIERLSMVVEKVHPIYKKIFNQLLVESGAPTSRLEAILDRALLEMSLFVLRKYSHYYSIGFILAFFNLKWVEARNLQCIIKGSERKIAASQVKKLLMIPDQYKIKQIRMRPS